MNKANECTCPSGDGSLVHPCPAHPAVEQACWDERKLSDLGNELHNLSCSIVHENEKLAEQISGIARELWNWPQARAALAQPSPPPHPASELDFSRPLETENGDPVKWICADVIEYKSARVCVAKDTGLVYSSPYIGLKIRNVMPEQAEAERPEGPTEDELEAAGLGYPLHKEEAVKLWYSGFRSEVITVLEAWEAIGHDIGMNPDKGELLDSLRYMLEKCEAHDAALAEVAGLRSLLNSLLCYVERDIDRMRSDRDKSDNKEIYDRSISLAMERLKAAQNAVFTTEPGCDTAVELAAQTTQAQHCVPELLVRAEDFVSGKEVPQAWLDVQAERRRQITAEGWTPEHDDLYCAAELPRAAAAYILNGANDEAPAIWPFSAKWWKPRDARSNYVRAGALILAEIERLDRAAAAGKEVGHE
ncbi:TPA: hypothetical protein ACXIEW_002590 [Pseudomonas aeruginosa]|uniref:hypothetical protein n=1 Tax=Pseudomonas aeruginosa TaxID=287 RepID=UPI001F0424AF|nr:hypothetical protein [Pseudomonas aeruginosa]